MLVALACIGAPGGSAAEPTASCGSSKNQLRLTVFGAGTTDSACGPITLIIDAPATGTLRVVGTGFTGYISAECRNSSIDARCVGEGQEGFVGGSFADGYFVDGRILGLTDRDGATRVTLTAGAYKLEGHAWGYGSFAVELVLD